MDHGIWWTIVRTSYSRDRTFVLAVVVCRGYSVRRQTARTLQGLVSSNSKSVEAYLLVLLDKCEVRGLEADDGVKLLF